MRVLFWSERFWPTIGGVSLSASGLLSALRKRGYEFTLVTLADYHDLPEEDEYQGIPVHRLPFWTALSTGDVVQVVELRRRVQDIKREFSADLIHIAFLGASVLFHFQTIGEQPMPLLVSLDSGIPKGEAGGSSLFLRTLRSADWVTCVSAASLARLREQVPEIVPRSSFLYEGREVPSVLPRSLPLDAPRLLYLGRLTEVKGVDLALAAFAWVAARFPKARLIIAGDGPNRPELQRQVTQLGILQVVDLIGWVRPDEVPALMDGASLVIIPSRSEGLPNVAKEAALVARPVVATRVGGLPEIILHQQTGLLVEPEDTSALAEAMVFCLDHPEESARMGQTARAHARERFSWEGYVEACDSLYRRLARAPKVAGGREMLA